MCIIFIEIVWELTKNGSGNLVPDYIREKLLLQMKEMLKMQTKSSQGDY